MSRLEEGHAATLRQQVDIAKAQMISPGSRPQSIDTGRAAVVKKALVSKCLPRLVVAQESISEALLAEGVPFIIRDVSLGPGWSPEALIKYHGNHQVSVFDSRVPASKSGEPAAVSMTLEDFFSLFQELGDGKGAYSVKLKVCCSIYMQIDTHFGLGLAVCPLVRRGICRT